MNQQTKIEARTCRCPKCVMACKMMPGKMMPDDAELAIAAGFAGKMMLDWYEPCGKLGNDERIFILAPASEGREGRKGPEIDDLYPDGAFMAFFGTRHEPQPCVLLKDGLCSIHDSGFKPEQCRTVFACEGTGTENIDIARKWDTDRGRELVERWKRTVNFTGETG